MYVVPLKGAIVEALRATFTNGYPEADFSNLWCSIEFPMDKSNYPGIWVQYDDTEEVSIAGIGHTEVVLDEQGSERTVTRSRFGGVITMTCVALSSLERDRLYDELIRMLLFARVEPQVSTFRTLIEQNDLVAMNVDFDKVRAAGDAAAPGTPWGTEEMLYERSVAINVIGEFISSYGTLYRLSKIIELGYPEGTPEPAFPDHPAETLDRGMLGSRDAHFEITAPPSTPLGATPGFNPGQWH